MPQRVKSLWEIAINEADQLGQQQNDKLEGTQTGAESTVIFMGSKSAGKTSIILRFLEKEEPPKPTTALEYTFGRKAKGHNMTKDVAHMWELGGGTFLSELVEVPIKQDMLLSSSFMLILDLSHPNELWITMDVLIQTTLKRIEQVISKLSVSNPKINAQIKMRSRELFGEDHPDKDMIDPFPLPLVIVGTKYDIFQDFDSEKRKMICKTLRFVAHNYGAALQFCSTKNEGLMNRTKAYVGHLVFGSPMSTSAKLVNFDHNRPIMVPFGMDSLDQIGLPPMTEADIGRLDAQTPLDLWRKAYLSLFPQQNLGDKLTQDDPAKDPQYDESAVDTMRQQKDKELERYSRQVERRSKDRVIGSGDM
ncbi:cytoplasmic dynein 2 light intermediate chain 1-like [Asterias rubens]|uniref:cytoplasmic dynein 2 light intermediate chain 1-like n=1 Tax=Asterias rubens TaxID=7604 RepID=UPI001454EC1A|nr:cytoplasmic dynein 2 light intermediate chain 1-like [Asterias rubens]XP_033645866.1 cytoplasmic dynein 2 light intermediate chain 1-like [Asterias rubens]